MLELFVLPPPLPALIGVLITIGVADLGFRLVPLIGLRGEPLDYAAGFMMAAAALCAVVHPLAWIGIPHLIGVVRGIGWTLAAAGLIAAPRWFVHGREGLARLFQWWRERNALDRTLALLIALIVTCYFLIAIGPACDGDALDYQLGAPLDWMLHGRIYPRWDWIHAHLVGLGELISMVGLASGTDNTGALFEFASLIAGMVAVTSFVRSPRERLMGALLIAGAPVMSELAIWQKPELMPAVAMTVALLMIARDWEAVSTATLMAAAVLMAFAMACKYSFILSAPVIAGAALIAARRARRMPQALMMGAMAVAVLPAQVWIRNYILYQDPLSPMLEFLKARPDPLVAGVGHYLSTATFYYSTQRTLWIHFFLVIHAMQFGAILGFGVFAFIPALRNRQPAVVIVMRAAAVVLVILLLFAQRMPRFFLEPYLWVAAVAAGAPDSLIKAAIKGLLALQAVAAAAIGIYYASVLFPGALTPSWRNRAMSSAGFFYDEALHLNAELPEGMVVLTMIESYALVRPPFITFDEVVWMTDQAQENERMRHYLSDGVASAIYLPQYWIDDLRKTQPELMPCLAEPMEAGFKVKHDWLKWYSPSLDETWRLFKLTPGCAGHGAAAPAHAG